ncbi:MAG TPA: tRNA dihydrouridine synthase DusB, partial [Thermoanaerobacter sp.]|nr:tRNA dihydrouridine synthase DusB [Thermoanaerobacter sp.]
MDKRKYVIEYIKEFYSERDEGILKIGDVVLKNNVFLSPMAGVTDKPFRLIC